MIDCTGLWPDGRCRARLQILLEYASKTGLHVWCGSRHRSDLQRRLIDVIIVDELSDMWGSASQNEAGNKEKVVLPYSLYVVSPTAFHGTPHLHTPLRLATAKFAHTVRYLPKSPGHGAYDAFRRRACTAIFETANREAGWHHPY